MTSLEMSELLGAADRTIRDDFAWIKKQIAESIKDEDIGLVIADIRMTYERFVERAEKSLKKCTPGTNVYLQHLKLMMDMQLKIVEALQSLGYYPKNLGNLTSTRYEFKAHVSKDGSVETRPVEAFDHLINADKNPDDRGGVREALDAEFEMVEPKALPASVESDGKEKRPDSSVPPQ